MRSEIKATLSPIHYRLSLLRPFRSWRSAGYANDVGPGVVFYTQRTWGSSARWRWRCWRIHETVEGSGDIPRKHGQAEGDWRASRGKTCSASYSLHTMSVARLFLITPSTGTQDASMQRMLWEKILQQNVPKKVRVCEWFAVYTFMLIYHPATGEKVAIVQGASPSIIECIFKHQNWN